MKSTFDCQNCKGIHFVIHMDGQYHYLTCLSCGAEYKYPSKEYPKRY